MAEIITRMLITRRHGAGHRARRPIGVRAPATAAILKQAAERGETRDDIPPRVAALPFDLLRSTLLLSPGDSRAITEIVDQVFLPLVSRSTRVEVRDP